MITRKNYLVLLLILLHFGSFLIAQPCLPDGIVLSSQDDIDNFQVNYPACTEIEGDVFIGGYLNNVNNLDGLDALVSIGGNLEIEGALSLTTLDGLDNLQSLGGGLALSLNNYLEDISALSNLVSIGNYISISGNVALSSLAGLENILELEGYLSILDNPTLISLYGLHGISSINNSVWIYGNGNLNDLSGLSGLEYVGGNMSIIGNDFLTDCQGLENLVSINGDLNLEFNLLMTSLSGFNSLGSIAGNLSIVGNTSLNDLTGILNLSTIGGDLKIGEIYGGSTGNPSLSSLSGLNNIDAASIQGLYILNNPLLSSCEVQSICNYLSEPGGIVEIQNNATGCNSFVEIEATCAVINCLPDGMVFNSQSQIDNFPLDYPNCYEIMGDVEITGDNISNLAGLSTLGGFWGSLKIENTSLVNLNGFESVGFIGGDLVISENELLLELLDLGEVYGIDGELLITENPNLISLAGLDNIVEGSIESLGIINNQSLEECHVESICNYLSGPDFVAEIEGNEVGCIDVEEVLNACESVGVKDYKAELFHVFPNPVNQSSFALQHQFRGDGESLPEKTMQLRVSDIYSRTLFEKNIRPEDLSTLVTVDTWPPGIYLLQVYGESTIYFTSRIIVL